MSSSPLPAEGTIVAALTHGGSTVHAGRVNRVDDLAAYSLSPQCLRYRKADGERPAALERGDYPMLVRRLDGLFADYVDGSEPLHGRRLCTWCVSVVAAVPSGAVPAGGDQ